MNVKKRSTVTIDVSSIVLPHQGQQMRSIAVVGGGVAGLTVATILARRGLDVKVYERAPALRELGAGLQISPNGACVLKKIGLDMTKLGIRSQGISVYDGLNGAQLAQFNFKNRDYFFVHREALIEQLGRLAREAGVTFKFGMRVETDGLPEADLVIGAGGVNCPMRKLLDPGAEPKFRNKIAWRALVEMEAPARTRLYVAPRQHLICYPIKSLESGKMLMNLVAIDDFAHWSERNWVIEDDPVNLRAAFKDLAPCVQDVLEKVQRPLLWGLFRTEIAQRWYSPAHRVVILGDSAHPTLPFLAQGANLALEDAWALGAMVGGNMSDYENERFGRAHRAIHSADSNGEMFHFSGLKRTVALSGLRAVGALIPNLFLRRYDWLYNYDVTEHFPIDFSVK